MFDQISIWDIDTRRFHNRMYVIQSRIMDFESVILLIDN